LENKLPVTIEKVLHEILCEALNYDLEYKEFVSALVSAYDLGRKSCICESHQRARMEDIVIH